MKSLIIINEGLSNMHLGQNTSLYYAVQELKNQNDVYIFNLDQNSLPNNPDQTVSCSFLGKDDKNSQILIEKYEFFNKKIISLIEKKDFDSLLQLKTPEVGEFISAICQKDVKFGDFDQIIQRIEPMKAPFPPLGDENIDDILSKLRILFPNKKLHLPINLNDKILPLKLNKSLGYDVATPTFITSLENMDFKEKASLASKSYRNIYNVESEKIVIKPINSAQSLGVFAIEFSKNGKNLKDFQEKSPSELKISQTFNIQSNLQKSELLEVFQILCFVQTSNSDKKISQIAKDEMQNGAKKLYNAEILIQPFIEGIKNGDVRVNVMKNLENNFYLGGYVYRKSIQEGDNFTTCYSGGKALSLPIIYLTKTEQENLRNKTNEILQILNTNLREEYKNVLELGFDFLLVGDDKNILLGEINHHCPALLPISEKLEN